jgi:hypothetical protein
MQLLEHTKYVVQHSSFQGKKTKRQRDGFSTSGDKILPETGLHFDLCTVHCTGFPVPLN